MILNILFLIIAYLLGSIPSGLWIGQVFFKKNLREYGSGNTGTTNTFRILGPTAGTIVFAIDFLKGSLAVWLPLLFHASGWSPIVFGLVLFWVTPSLSLQVLRVARLWQLRQVC